MLFKVCYVENDKITPIQQFNGYFSNEDSGARKKVRNLIFLLKINSK